MLCIRAVKRFSSRNAPTHWFPIPKGLRPVTITTVTPHKCYTTTKAATSTEIPHTSATVPKHKHTKKEQRKKPFSKVDRCRLSTKRIGNSINYSDALEAFHQLTRKHSVQPNVFVYHAMMSACRRFKLFKDAFTYYDDMKRTKVAPSQHIFAVLMQCCHSLRDMQRANEIFEEMTTTFGLQPTTWIMNTILDLAIVVHDIPTALRYMKLMQDASDSLEPNLWSFLAFFNIAVRLGSISRAESLVSVIRSFSSDLTDQQKRSIEMKLANGLLRCYATAKDHEKLMALWDEILANEAITPNAESFSVMINEMAFLYQSEKAIELFEMMRTQYGIRPTIAVYAALFRAFGIDRVGSRTAERQSMLLRFVEESKRLSAVPDMRYFTYLTAALVTTRAPLHIMKQVMSELKASDEVAVPTSIYRNAIQACVAAKDITQAREYFEESYSAANSEPDIDCVLALLDVYAETGAFAEFMSVTESLLNRFSTCREHLNDIFVKLMKAAFIASNSSSSSGGFRDIMATVDAFIQRENVDVSRYMNAFCMYQLMESLDMPLLQCLEAMKISLERYSVTMESETISDDICD